MPTRTETSLTLAAALALAGSTALAAEAIAPAHPLDQPAALMAAFAARIGHRVDVLEFRLGEHHARMLVQTGEDFDEYEAIPGQVLAQGTPRKAGSVECRKKLPFDAVDAALGVRLLAQARTIAAANGYEEPPNLELGAGMMCEELGWRVVLHSERNSEVFLHLTWSTDGAKVKARELRDGGWHKVDPAKLLAGAAQVAPAAPPKALPRVAGDGRKRDFLRSIDADLERLAASTGAPLALRRIGVDATQLSVDLYRADDRRRVSTWLVDADGRMQLWREDKTMPLDCNKPFATGDFPLAQLPAMIADAPGLVAAMPGVVVKDVAIYRSGFCGKPHVYIRIEDERGYGNVEFDQAGRLLRADIQ